MGYTHYWTFKKQRGNSQEIEVLYQKAIKDCQKIILAYSKVNGGLSGYSAHTKIGQYGGINFNGSKDEGHETFVLREHFSQNFEDSSGFNFCKTAQKPYDRVVTACLSVLKQRLGDAIKVSSDGRSDDWTDGVKLASKVLNRKINNPIDKG